MIQPSAAARSLRCLLAVLLFLPLTGCLVVSLQPIYDEATLTFDEGLLGAWRENDDGDTVTFTRGAWKAYEVSYVDGSDTSKLTGHLTRVANRLVLDLTLHSGVEEPPGTVQVHWAFLVDVKDGALSLRPLSFDWFKARIGQPAVAALGPARDGDQNVVLTSPTPALRGWLTANLETPGLWDDATVFSRKADTPPPVPAPPRETEPVAESHEADDYTRYELLAPETASFKIVYEVTATTPGARHYFNVIRKGSQASDEAVYDQHTGAALPFTVVTGAQARSAGLPSADLDASYIQVALASPVPAGGETRLRIDKTYTDAVSYFREGSTIVFSRSLGIRRNAIVLPAGYELIACNMPSQVAAEDDGRLRVSFMNVGPGPVPLVIKARPLPAGARPAAAPSRSSRRTDAGPAAASAASSPAARLAERARQDREIVYFLQQPETHAFALYHDYTERRAGIGQYLNVVRAGSRVSNPSARLLDTGEALAVETLSGDAITRAAIDIGEPVAADTEVVVIRFPAVAAGRSARLRIQETYTDEGRYYLDGDELVWDRSLGRSRNAVVLPSGWYLTATSIPATVTALPDGRLRLDYDNPRTDDVAVLLKAARR